MTVKGKVKIVMDYFMRLPLESKHPAYYKMTKSKLEKIFTPTLSGFGALKDVTLIILNWLASGLFTNIFHHLNFVEVTIFVIFLKIS